MLDNLEMYRWFWQWIWKGHWIWNLMVWIKWYQWLWWTRWPDQTIFRSSQHRSRRRGSRMKQSWVRHMEDDPWCLSLELNGSTQSDAVAVKTNNQNVALDVFNKVLGSDFSSTVVLAVIWRKQVWLNWCKTTEETVLYQLGDYLRPLHFNYRQSCSFSTPTEGITFLMIRKNINPL